MLSGINFTPTVNQSHKKGEVTITRDGNGNIQYLFNEAKSAKIGNVGTVDGNAILTFESTGKTNESQLTYHHEGDTENNIELANVSGGNYNITGEKASVTSAGGNAERTIQVDAHSSTIDLSDAAGSQYVYMTETSHDNKTTLGYGSDNYIDAGKFNSASDVGGTNRYETTGTSHGAVISGGNGNDHFFIGGKYGILNGGTGNDNFDTVGVWSEEQDASYRNIILGGLGNDTMSDWGGYNIFLDENGNNTYVANGKNGIAYLGQDSSGTGVFSTSSEYSYVFTDVESTVGGKVHNLYNQMKKYGWMLEEFLENDSKISELNPDSIANHNVVSKEIMDILKYYFRNNP